MISQYKNKIIIFLTTVVTAACLFCAQNNLIHFLIIGVTFLILGFSILYHFHIIPHKKDLNNIKHFFNPDFIFHHIHSLVLGIILFISSTSILYYISNTIFEIIIIGIYIFSIVLLQNNISKGYKNLFKYEQSHLHAFNIVKMVAIIFSTNMIVFIMDNQIVHPLTLSLFSFILYYCLLQIFRSYHHSYKKQYVQLFIFGISSILTLTTFLFSQVIVANSLVTVSILMIYYMLWGMFKHYLTNTLHKRIIFEYILLTLLVISFAISQSYFWERTL